MSNVSYIQEFGSLIVLDLNLDIVGISAYALQNLEETAQQVLNKPFDLIAKRLFGDSAKKIYTKLDELKDNLIPRQLMLIQRNSKHYYLKLSLHDQKFFIELEEQQHRHISATKMNEMSFLLDRIQADNWTLVCKAINRILDFDRVLAVQILETGYSKIIAEDVKMKTSSMLNKEFSSQFMPPEVFPYYCSYSYRYVPDIGQKKQEFYSAEESINLLDSQLAPLPNLHRLFLNDINVRSVVFFPIYVEGQCWGLLIAHHHSQKNIDLQERKLCTFAIQNASSKYESHLKQHLLEQNEHLQVIEDKLKTSLSENNSVNCAMAQNMDILMSMTKSDGFAIYHQGDLFFHGDCPTQNQLEDIISFLQQHSSKEIFKDYNFRLNRADYILGQLPIAGVMSLQIGTDKDYYLLWFRLEHQTKAVQLRLDNTDPEQASHVILWEDMVHDSAIPWDDIDIQFVLRLRQIIGESIYNKIKEKQLATEQVHTLNNELEMFTFTLSHDLKNPISILKMGLQYLQKSATQINGTTLEKWLTNLDSSVNNIEDIVQHIVKLSQHKMNILTKDPVPMAYSIKKIAQEAKMVYEASQCDIRYGNLLPIWGEKSALYQIFSNVVGNAVKYAKDQDSPVITIDSTYLNDAVQYRIKDNGIGIPAENLPHIFEMFNRGKNAVGIQGSGVGLSLVKRIMERLGGTVSITSTLGEGTEISLSFPMVAEFPESMLKK